MAEEKEKLWGTIFFCPAIYTSVWFIGHIVPEPNQISLAFVSLETPVAEEKKNMVATVEVRIFLTLLSLSYEKFVVTLRMAALYRILILCVGFALSNNLWAQSREFGCRNFDGVWQEKTHIVNSAFLARYTINGVKP